MKGELEIGDILEVDKIRLECREATFGNPCTGCFWLIEEEYHCNHEHQKCGLCSHALRSDDKDVIFVKVGEVQDA